MLYPLCSFYKQAFRTICTSNRYVLAGIQDANIWLPNTGEVFRGADKYIAFNKKYPGRWFAQVQTLFTDGTVVISIVKVVDEEETAGFFVTSIFSFSGQLISDIKEYWGENGDAPQWRLDEGLSEFY